jgi:hypothetical protein
MQSSGSLLLALFVATASIPKVQGDQGQAVDLSSFVLKHGPCFHTKIQQDGDDDGNSFFYNGSYRAQYNRYASFFMCKSGQCDYTQEYVVGLDDYLQTMTNYLDNMCQSCANNCRRVLEDKQNNQQDQIDADWQVNCNTCANDCAMVWKAQNEDNESNYLECQFSYQVNDISYYSAPQCRNGRVVIGHFYDNECSVKTGKDFKQEFSYFYFQTMESIKVDCSSGLCDNLYGEALSCVNGYAESGNDDTKLCKAAVEASKIRTYYKKPWFKKLHVKRFFFFVLSMGFSLSFLTYIYFVRHRRAKIPLANLDGSNLPELT